MFPYGTQYFREPNPPESEWEKDFDRMADAGFTIVKIWAMWSWVHLAEDTFDFANLDRMFELAQERGLKIVVNTILENAPYWLAHERPEALYETSKGLKFQLIARSNTPGGAWPGLCWDNEIVRDHAGKFLTQVGARYSDNPALWGYDVWNEVFFEPYGHPGFEGEQFCYCAASKSEFTKWLQRRYGDLGALCRAWHRKYTDWEQVYPPPYQGTYPDWLDWLRFRLDRMKEQMQWRVSTLRSVDQTHPLSSHGVAWSVNEMATFLSNDLNIAEDVDQWGLSAFPAWQHLDASGHMRLLDITRSASQAAGKRFWQNELQGGPAANGLSRSVIPSASDVSFWNWTAFMCGADGLMYWQWRPELLGPESPGFGICRTDGTPTERTEAASWFSRFMNEHPELSEAQAVAGDVGILALPESQLFNFVSEFNAQAYAGDVMGIYQALWEHNIVADFVGIDRIGQYKVVYLPFPLLIEAEHAEALRIYVEDGGTLISHACPAHYDDNAYCSFQIPGLGLDRVFGALEDETDFVPSLKDAGMDLPEVEWNGGRFSCSVYQERLSPSGGEVISRFTDGSPAVIDCRCGRGRARLIGTFPGLSYWSTREPAAADFIRDGLRYAGVQQMVQVSDASVKARLRIGPNGAFLWVLNSSDQRKDIDIQLSNTIGTVISATDVNTGSVSEARAQTLHTSLEAKSGMVALLRLKGDS
jgi:beta-galactosidase